VIKSKKMRWARACRENRIGEKCNENICRKTWRDHSEDVGVGERIILEWILGKWHGKVWTGCIWPRIGTSDGVSWTR
jgi:hypothetical protein